MPRLSMLAAAVSSVAFAFAPLAATAAGDEITPLDATMSTQAFSAPGGPAASMPALGGLSAGAVVVGGLVLVTAIAIAVDDGSDNITSTTGTPGT